MFGSTITDEYVLLYERLDFPMESLKKLTENAATVSFLPASDKQDILKQVADFWQFTTREFLY